MPLSTFEEAALAFSDAGAWGRYRTSLDNAAALKEKLEMQRIQQRNQAVTDTALQILKVAPQGSKARALAITSLNNAGFGNNALLKALQESGPAPAAQKTKVVGRELVDESTGEVIHRAAQDPTRPGQIERLIDTVAKSPEDREKLIRGYIEGRSIDPFKQMIGQMLGVGGTPLPETEQPSQNLSPTQQQKLEQARMALSQQPQSRQLIIMRLKDKYGFTDEQLRANGIM